MLRTLLCYVSQVDINYPSEIRDDDFVQTSLIDSTVFLEYFREIEEKSWTMSDCRVKGIG